MERKAKETLLDTKVVYTPEEAELLRRSIESRIKELKNEFAAALEQLQKTNTHRRT
jgi:hypothetical protein